MVLRNDSNSGLYEELNGPRFWPFSYAALRQILDAHNAVIKAWARTYNVTVVDIDGRMPARPDLRVDPWHDNDLGQNMRAWLVFQALVPLLVRDLRTGEVPHANGLDSDVHPYLDKSIERIDRGDWLTTIDARPKMDFGPVSVGALAASREDRLAKINARSKKPDLAVPAW